MPEPVKVLHAELREIRWDRAQQAVEINSDKTVQVQFNPETLKVNFSNQSVGGDQRGGSARQFVGAGTTKLTLELWFDVTAPLPEMQLADQDDVRRLTEKVAYFIRPVKQSGEEEKYLPPGVRFIWGTFMFDGVMDSLDENLEFFSEDGKPLRASVSISVSKQEIQFQFGNQKPPGLGSSDSPGTNQQAAAQAGDSVQKMAGRANKQNDWQKIAAANGIENPRILTPGTLIDLNAGITGRLGASAGGGSGATAALGAGAGAAVSGKVSFGGSATGGVTAGVSAGGNFGVTGQTSRSS